MGLGMGFNMKLKTLFVLISATFLFNSCLKKQDLESQDLGPAIANEEIQSKMDEAIGELNLAELNVNESNIITSSITLEDNQNIKRSKQELLVKAINISENDFSVDFIQSYENYLQPDLSFYNVAKNFNPAQLKNDDPLLLPVVYYYTSRLYCKEKNVTCHNLSLNPLKIEVNPLLFDTKICPENDKCFISTRKIEFDLLDGNELNDQGKPSRNHYTLIVAPQLPFLSKVLSYCVRGLMPYGNRKVVAENCVVVNSANSGAMK